jgi:hypothetical protein
MTGTPGIVVRWQSTGKNWCTITTDAALNVIIERVGTHFFNLAVTAL